MAERLDVPRGQRRFPLLGFLRLNPDAVGRFAEGIARFLGTGRFLAVQTIIVAVWIALNVFAVRLRSSSACTRSRSACRFCASRISGAAYAACVENARLSRMNGYGSQRSCTAVMFSRIQTITMIVWMAR